MPNNYARLQDFKASFRGTNTSNDAELLRKLEQASRWFDRSCRRVFYALQATRLYDFQSAGYGFEVRNEGRWLDPRDDIISVTSMLADNNGDGVFEITLVQDTDYWLWPNNPEPNEPYRDVRLNPYGTQLSSWPRGERRVKITGLFGYSYELEAAGALGGIGINASVTSFDLAAGHTVQLGDTLVLDAEQMYVSALVVNTVTVTRGLNGTTAAAHANGAAASIRRYPRDLENAVMLQTMRLLRNAQTGFDGAAGAQEFGGIQPASTYPMIRDSILRLRREPAVR